MNRVALPYTTVSSGISVFDSDNHYRPILWDVARGSIDWLQQEDNGLLLTLIEKFSPNTGTPMNQPIIRWIEDERLNIHTTLSATSTSTDTTLDLTDPRIAVVNTFLFCPTDGEVMKVTAVDYATSVATVTRGYNGTARVAKAAGATIISMPAFMAELSDLNLGNGRLPGLEKWNCISIVSETCKVSRLQQGSETIDGWGKIEKAAIDTLLNVRRQVGKALMFNARGTNTTASDGQEYVSNGLYHYIEDGVLDLGEANSNLTWPVLNDWLEARFDPDASSDVKELMAGQWLFKAIMRMKHDMGETVQSYFEPAVGARVYTINIDGGYTVNVYGDKYGLAVNEKLGDWGFLLDMKHIEGRHFNDMQFQWLQNVQPTRSVMYREDAYLGSFSLILKHEDCHGMIRGAGLPIVTR